MGHRYLDLESALSSVDHDNEIHSPPSHSDEDLCRTWFGRLLALASAGRRGVRTQDVTIFALSYSNRLRSARTCDDEEQERSQLPRDSSLRIAHRSEGLVSNLLLVLVSLAVFLRESGSERDHLDDPTGAAQLP